MKGMSIRNGYYVLAQQLMAKLILFVDIFFILLHYALELQGVTILFDTGTGNKKRLIDIAN
jgi:hypothetical protein